MKSIIFVAIFLYVAWFLLGFTCGAAAQRRSSICLFHLPLTKFKKSQKNETNPPKLVWRGNDHERAITASDNLPQKIQLYLIFFSQRTKKLYRIFEDKRAAVK